MGFNDEYLKLRKKRLEAEESRRDNTNQNKVYLDTLFPKASSDIAPVRQTTTEEEQTEATDERKWFEKGAFEDGYQFGDLTKTIVSSSKDLETNVLGGILGIGEKVVDAGAYIVGGIGGLFSKDFKDDVGSFIEKDLYDEEAVARKIVGARTPLSWFDKSVMDEGNSVLGEKTDALAQSGGQLLGTIGLQSVGVPWFVTSGVTSFGSEAENALNQGATYGQAGLSAAITAGVEIATEKLFGGSGLGETGLINLDGLTKGISNKVGKALLDFGIDMTAEGAEEIASQIGSNFASALYSEKNLQELLFSEEAFDQYLESFIGGMALGGFANVGKVGNSIKTGQDYRTGLTESEQKVFDNVYNKRVAEAEEGGKELSKKEKDAIYDSVVNDLEKGRIDIDTIEETLGEDVYKSYKDTIDYEDDILKQFEELGKKTNPTLAEMSLYDELKSQYNDIKQNSQREYLKENLSNEVFGKVKDTKLAESYNERARRGQVFEADLSQYDEKQQEVIKRAVESGILNNTNRTHEFVDLIAKISADKGVLFDFTNNAKLKESGFAVDGKEVNGFVTKDGITLNIDSHKALQSTVGHEITHVLEGTELYAEMQRALFDYAKSKGDFDGRRTSLAELYKDIEGADVDAELTADLVGDYLFTDEDFVKHLSTQNRNVFQKIYDEIKYLLKVVTAGSKEARELEKVKRAFDKAYKESGKVDTKAEDFYDAKTKYSLTVKDAETLDFLNNQETIKTYKTMQLVDGKLYPPMAARTDGKYEDASELGVWEQATEHPELIKNGNKFKLDKGKGQGSIEAAYNPYMHSSNLVLNDQFSGAYKRDNLVTVECEVPVSELTSGYHAEFAKDSVGWHPWHTGTVAGQLRQARGTERQVFLSRWIKPVRIVPDSEVAAMYKELLDGTDVEVPDNVVTPSLLNELKKAGVKIKESGRVKYSLTDSDGKQLTKEQQEYFKDSKMRDENGNLKVMYHGSQDAGFHVFDPAHSDDETSLFFVDRNDVAATYSGTTETYEAQTIRTAEDMNKFIESIGVEGYEVVKKDGKFTLLYEGDRVADSNTAQGIYEEFCWYEGVGEGDANYKVYLNLTNPLVVDAEGRNWNNVSREFSQEVADRYNSLTAEEKDALTNLAEWGEYGIFKDEMLASAKGGSVLASADEDISVLARAYQKLGGANANLYDAFSIASDNFSAESIQEFAVKQMNTRDYAQKAKAEGYDGVIFNNLVDVGGYSNGSEGASTVAIAFSSNQIKSVANEQPGKNADIRYSLSSDSEGRTLSDEQKKYFNGSKVVDANGNLKVMHHGSPETFTVFDRKKAKSSGTYGNGFYFTDSTSHAATYGDAYDVYLNITNPLQNGTNDITKDQIRRFVEAIAEDEDYGIDNYGYDATIDSVTDSVYGKSDFAMILDLNISCIGNMVEAIELFNKVNGTDYDGIIAPTETVAFYPNQIKSVDNLKPTGDPDIRYSLTEYTAEEKKSHNKAVLDHFGKTYSWAETGYLLLDGSKLDLSGKHDGAPGGYRTVDHRDITEALGYDYGGGDYSGSLVQFMSEGNIRIVPEINGFNLSVKPTKAQEQALSDFISRARGEVVLDIDDLKGNTVVSVEYPRGTYHAKVLNDIREWFDNGKQPETSGLSAFRSLTKKGEPQKRYGNYNIYGKDVRYEAPMQEQVAPTQETVSKMETVAEETAEQSQAPMVDTLPEKSNAPLVEIANQARLENLHGAYTQDGKQYLSDGSFAAEFYTVDDSLENVSDYPIKRVQRELTEAFKRQTPGNYNIDQAEIAKLNDGERKFAKVGNALFDVKYVDALNRAIENPLFTLSHIRGGIDALTVVGDNGRAVLMPVRAGDNVTVAYEAKLNLPVTDIDYAPIPEAEANAMQSENIAHIDDADAPPEMEAPYYGETQDAAPIDPFEDRDMKEVSRNRKTPAYMYENPEVKPFFQKEANILLGELERVEKPETIYNGWAKWEMSYEAAQDIPEIYRTERIASDTIVYLRDTIGMSYADIEKGLKAIIEDNGAENIAAAKKLEFVINDRLLNGYYDDGGFEIPADQDYINLLTEKQIREYSEEARKQFFDVADAYAPQEDIAPVAESKAAPVKEQYEAIRPKREKSTEPRLKRVTDADEIAPTVTESAKSEPTEGKTAEVYDTEPETGKKKSRGWSRFRANFLDKQSVFEDLALKTNNRELMGKANYILSAEKRAQRLIGKGKSSAGVKSLNDIRAEVESTGKTKQFYEYLYHRHNIDRMSLEDKAAPTIGALRSKFGHLKLNQVKAIAAKEITEKTTERTANTIREAKQYLNAIETKNKPVFGDSVTADVSRAEVAKYEAANPEFKAHAQDVYDYMSYLRGQLVESGVISQETALLWSQMYPHYVPIRRLGDTGLNINVPLDTGRTGVNAPIKRATGGSRDILPLFDTMALRTEQTYKAIAKNNFGVELKNTLGSTIESAEANLDEMIDSVDAHEELLKKGENGRSPTFTVFEDGKKVTFAITEDMYDALKPTSDDLRYTNKVANTVGNIHRGLLTEYNPTFMLTNAIKDAQDILINSQHPAKTYANLPNAIAQMAKNGTWYQEYLENGGESNTYFDGQSNTFTKDDTGIKKIIGMPLRAISALNNYVERAPRLAEYIASRKAGASAEVAMLDAARVTTNFAAGGDVTKFANRNGFTFLNASVQGAMQQVRNVREAKANGLKGWVQLATKVAIAGIPAMILNNLLWDDDEEYEQLSDYVKDNYYVVAKFGDGQFVRIPKGRAMAVIQDALEQVGNALTGNDEVDLENFLELAISNLAPNNPLDNNILAPIGQVLSNKTWYGDDLVPTRLQDLPASEQFDESTDSISKWLGEKLNVSPYKLNYLLNQYSGGIGDVVLPMLTPEAESGDNSLVGNLLAPMRDKFTTDSVMNNQNVSDFYDTVDKLTANAKSSYATDEDILKYKYMNSVNADLSELYKQKREIQNSSLSDADKYEAVRDIQKQIDTLAEESLNTYGSVNVNGIYATVGDLHFRWYEPGEDSEAEPGWQKISDKQLEKQEEVTSGLGISPSTYWENKSEYDFAYEYPGKYAVAKSVGGYEKYKTYQSELYDIKADKDEDGKSISGSRKEKVADYINNLDADYGEKIILFKSEYNADDTYNYEIIDYLNNREDISYDEMVSILKELGFTVKGDTITWD